ncbi:hypothetical protein EIP91_008464 [Steccherinum ochraceum]|uniref:TFIIS N-terminal domain-containing protein n=1 Tax=Steccherinum ochraceum TaxID=92696 RepID=A0A4R0RY76_9APHY|nr:hypothetical protein EIP91_008464 [Steccherinum ochraceum]
MPQHSADSTDPVASAVAAEWKPSSSNPPASSSAAVGQHALEVPEFSLPADLAGPSSTSSPIASQPSAFFQYNQQAHNYWPSPATYNSVSYPGPSWTNSQSQIPLSSYSSLNGATSSQGFQGPGSSSQMVIDPALTTVNGQSSRTQATFSPANYLLQASQQYQFYQQPSHTQPSSINPSFVHVHPPHFPPRNNRPTILSQAPAPSPPQNTLSPFILQHDPTLSMSTTLPTSSASPVAHVVHSPVPLTPTPEQLKEKLLSDLKPFLLPTSFTGAGAVTHLTDVIKDYGVQEVDPQVRSEIATKIRDNAGNHYFRAWLENPLAMEITKEWLRACVGKEDAQLQDTVMPLLQIVDRLPMSLNSLRNNKLGKIVVRLGKDAATPAVKDMASNLERKWRMMIGQTPKEMEIDSTEDAANRKRKADPSVAKAGPPPKRTATSPAVGTKPQVKKESKPSSKDTKEVKESKSDTSFFSAPKPKPKLPSFKKAPVPIVKKELDNNVAQPSSVDPFQEALKLMAPKIKRESPSSATPPAASTSNLQAVPSKPNRKGKSVTWAPDDQLEMIKVIERAVYDDEPAEGSHVPHNLRDLDRGEGAALHAAMFEEQIDWYDPPLIQIPSDLDVPERGKDSQEKDTQDLREQAALGAVYMSSLHIPESPAEPAYFLPDEEVDQDVRNMVAGPDADAVFWSAEAQAMPVDFDATTPSVADLVGQLQVPDVEMRDPYSAQPASSFSDLSQSQPANPPMTPEAIQRSGQQTDLEIMIAVRLMTVLGIVDGPEKMVGTSVVEGGGEGAAVDAVMVLDRLDENHAVSLQQEGEHQILTT